MKNEDSTEERLGNFMIRKYKIEVTGKLKNTCSIEDMKRDLFINLKELCVYFDIEKVIHSIVSWNRETEDWEDSHKMMGIVVYLETLQEFNLEYVSSVCRDYLNAMEVWMCEV